MAAKVKEGSSPFRVYTCTLADQVVAEYLSAAGPIGDLGCGTGGHARFFKNSAADHLYVGLDIASSQAWRTPDASSHQPRRRFVQTSASALGIASETLSFTFSSSSLEHVPDVHLATRELARTMRPGAYGLHILPGVWSFFLYIFHGYRRFAPSMLKSLFLDAGFEIVEMWALGGLPSMILHGSLITIPGKLPVFDRMRSGKGLTLYIRLLRLALRLDERLPFPAIGYGVLIRKPEPKLTDR
jgi:SAM-dependent methyltransferase